MHNKILSLFNYNLECDFLKSILEENSEVNYAGGFIINFTKKFNDKTYHLFDTISVKDFGPCSNIILSSKNFNMLKLYRFKKLINDLFKIYGPDNRNGKYSIMDFRDLSDKGLDFCQIRNWPGIEKELLPCGIDFYRAAKKLTLTIFGATIDPEIKYVW